MLVNGTRGIELWKTNGTSDGTMLARESQAGSADGVTGPLLSYDNGLYFQGLESDGSTLGEFFSIQAPIINGDPTADVRALYREILGREADTGGLNTWVGQVYAGMSREWLVDQFWRSQEHRVRQVESLYRNLLGREADSGGRTTWVGALQSGQSEEQVVILFLISPEYTSRNAGNAAFLTALYRDLLGRDADAAGLSFWLTKLASTTPQFVAQSFQHSAERQNRLIDEYYAGYVERNPSILDKEAALTKFYAGKIAVDVAGSILASDEFWTLV